MIKLYPPTLHNAIFNFQKRFLPTAALLLLLLHSGTLLYSQCVPPPAPLLTPNPVYMCVGDPPVKVKVSPVVTTTAFCSGTVNMAIPDNNQAGGSNSVNVTINPFCTITEVKVIINMQHTRAGDMVFVLRSPSFNVLNLDYKLSGTGGSGPTTGFTNTVISSIGTVALSLGTDPYTGTFKADAQTGTTAGPTGMLPTAVNWASLLSVPNGNWTLGFYDAVTGQTGTLNSWCLSFTYACSSGTLGIPAIWTPFAGLYYDPAATGPYTGLPVDSLYVRPIPAGIYTYQVTTLNLPAGSPAWSFSNTTPIAIPIGGAASVYSADLIVAGLPTSGFKVKSVVLNNLSHSKPEDIDIVLISPSGQAVLLMSDVGGTSAVTGVTYTIADIGLPMTMLANPTGIYRPSNNGTPDNFPPPGPIINQPFPALNFFTGNMNGTWQLFVADDDGSAGLGSIAGGYTINFDTTTSACVSSPTNLVVNVGVPSTIVTQPTDQYVCVGNDAHFNVVATGGALTYQWQVSTNGGVSWNNLVNAAPYMGVTTSSLTIIAPPLSMNGLRYRVMVNGNAGCSSATSNFAILHVNPLPAVTIWAFPNNEILPGETATIFSSVSPNPAATYTWFRDGIVLPGANSDTLLVDFSGLGDYQLSVTDINGCTGLSNIVKIKDTAGKIFIYPNPSTGRLLLRMYSQPNTTVPLTISAYNNMGLRVFTRSYTQTVSYERIEVDLRRYGKGFFWVEVLDRNNKRIHMTKVLVQ